MPGKSLVLKRMHAALFDSNILDVTVRLFDLAALRCIYYKEHQSSFVFFGFLWLCLLTVLASHVKAFTDEILSNSIGVQLGKSDASLQCKTVERN